MIGCLVLYGSKVGQSNILPTNINCFPYTDDIPDIKEILINIFTKNKQSMKIKFPPDSKNALLDIFREYKNESSSHFLANYFISIIESLLSFNFSSFNFMLNGMNSIPESVILLLGPILFPIFLSFLFITDCFYFIYLWFSEMSWFFKENQNKDTDNKPNWVNISFIEPINYAFAFGLVFLFVILFFVFGITTLPVLPLITITWCIFTCLFTKSVLNNKPTNILDIISMSFQLYKVPLMIIMSIFLILTVFSSLGSVPGIISIFIILLIYFKIIPIDLYNNMRETENMYSQLVGYDQAKRICKVKKPTSGLFSFFMR